MKEYKKPIIEIEKVLISEILLDSPALEDGGENDWDNGLIEDF